MPRSLPGFYWDAERNRYFPGQPPITPKPPTPPTLVQEQRSRHVPLWKLASLTGSAATKRATQSVLHARFAATEISRPNSVHAGDRSISSFSVRLSFIAVLSPDSLLDRFDAQFLGDTGGWLYSRESIDDSQEWTPWTAEFCLAPNSEISALCTTHTPTGPRCVAVCFGPKTKICVQDAPDRMSLLSLSTVHDVRSASLTGPSLVLGAARGVAYLADLDASGSVRNLPTGSDVFSVAQHESLVYAGTRGGAVLRFDIRIPTTKPASHILTESTAPWEVSASPPQRTASTASLVHPTNDGLSLVVSFMDGRLGTLDTRFVRPHSRPALVYAGHVGSVSMRLGTAVDPSERFLFAAGGDCRLRGWALDTGIPLLPNSNANSPFAKSTCFADPLIALQFGENDEEPLPVLWGAEAGGALWRWRLGV
ncbi:hypothetical protein C8F01DRAFT_1245776 [Mycena amicta]|nr:hypothetical protein C8F01DRAFT_1245776 [Mycena amicta]